MKVRHLFHFLALPMVSLCPDQRGIHIQAHCTPAVRVFYMYDILSDSSLICWQGLINRLD